MASTDRVYVAVYAYFNEDGLLLPREIVWEDGCRYPIDRVLFVETAAAQKAGSGGDRYTIKVGGHQTYLFFERSANLTGNNIGRWFVERK